MVLRHSLDIPLGTPLPKFTLKDPHGTSYSSDRMVGENGLLVAVTCNHCPYALAVWPRLLRLAGYAQTLGIHTIAINPNIHPDYPEDSPQMMAKKIADWHIVFPYLIDDTQAVARALKAQCTPDLYLFDRGERLAYHGRIDDNWKDEARVTRDELKTAIECLARDEPVPVEQYPSIGCSIKWQT